MSNPQQPGPPYGGQPGQPGMAGPPQGPPQRPPGATQAMPPTATGPTGGGQAPPPGTPSRGSGGSGGSAKSQRPWQIATVVLALTTVAALVWGFLATRNANDQQAAMQAQIDQLKTQMASEETTASQHLKADAERLRQFEAQIKGFKGSLKIDTQDLRKEAQQIKTLQQQYAKEKQAAAAEDASLQDKLSAANSQAQLAEHCSAVLASGLTKIYEDVPTIVTYKEVAAVLNLAAASCQGVVAVSSPG